MDAAPGPRRASDIHPSILLSLEELAAVWAARPVTCRPDEVLQAPVFWNSHHVGHEGSECDDRHRDDVRLRWHGWMQGPWSVWQMPIPEPMRLIQSPRPSPPCPQIREPPPASPIVAGPGSNMQPIRCGMRAARRLALGPWRSACCCIAAVGQPLTPCRRLPPGVRAVNLSQSEIAIQLWPLALSLQIHPSHLSTRPSLVVLILESKFELGLLFTTTTDQTRPHGLTCTLSHVSSSHDSAPLFPA